MLNRVVVGAGRSSSERLDSLVDPHRLYRCHAIMNRVDDRPRNLNPTAPPRVLLEPDPALGRLPQRHGSSVGDAELEMPWELLDHDDKDSWEIASGRSDRRDPLHASPVARLRAG